MIIIYFFEFPIIALVMLMTVVLGIEPGPICLVAGAAWGIVGIGMTIWALIGGPWWETKTDRNWGLRIFTIVFMILFAVIPGWNIFQIGLGMGDKMLLELILGR